jgi:hypothetical protein
LEQIQADKGGQQEPELIAGQIRQEDGNQHEGAGHGQYNAINGHREILLPQNAA